MKTLSKLERPSRPNSLIFPYLSFYFPLSILIILCPEINRLLYTGIRPEYFEVMPFSYMLGEAIVVAFR